MKQRMKLNNKNSKFVKSLSVAALAELTFFGAHAYAQRVYAQDFGEESNRYLPLKARLQGTTRTAMNANIDKL
jgi:hypothetical protein